MTSWPVGLSTGSFFRMSIFEILEQVRESGFSMLEISSSPGHLNYREPEELRRLAYRLRELRLEAFSFHGPLSEHLDLSSAEEEHRRRSLEHMLGAAEAAARLEASHLIVHPGPDRTDRGSGAQHGARLERAAEALKKIRQRCSELGIILVLENMLPHLSLGQTGDLLRLIDALDSEEEFGVCLDTGHAHLAGDIYDLPRHIGRRLAMVHAHDNTGSRDDHLPPGKGRIDWKLLLGRLAEQAFHGPLMLELSGENHYQASELLAEARAGREVLEKIQRGLG